jgi:hypothetical protein
VQGRSLLLLGAVVDLAWALAAPAIRAVACTGIVRAGIERQDGHGGVVRSGCRVAGMGAIVAGVCAVAGVSASAVLSTL